MTEKKKKKKRRRIHWLDDDEEDWLFYGAPRNYHEAEALIYKMAYMLANIREERGEPSYII